MSVSVAPGYVVDSRMTSVAGCMIDEIRFVEFST